MVQISGVFLLVLAAEASPTTFPPLGYCIGEDYDGKCRVVLDGDHCKFGAHAVLGSPPECPCVCEPWQEKPVEVCCDTKTVGEYSYKKVHWGSGKVPSNCKNDCVYTRNGQPGSKYCFADGEQEVHCLDGFPAVNNTFDERWDGETYLITTQDDYADCSNLCISHVPKGQSLPNCTHWTWFDDGNDCVFYYNVNGLKDDTHAISGEIIRGGTDIDEDNLIQTVSLSNGKTYNSSTHFCGKRGGSFSDKPRFESSGHVLIQGFNYYVDDTITTLQGVYGSVNGYIHGGKGNQLDGYSFPSNTKIVTINVQCTTFQSAGKTTTIVGGLTFFDQSGELLGIGKQASTTNVVNVPSSCTLAFFSGRDGGKVDAIRFWWEC